MSNSLTIQEQRHQIWKKGTIAAGSLTILFGLLFYNQSDPLWAGLLRLAAFIFFSLTVFGALKLLNGPLTITIHSSPTHLKINYRMKEKNVRKEQFEQSAIQEFIPSTEYKPFWKQLLQPRSSTLKVRFSDGHRDIPLFEYGGRILFFDEATLARVQKFLTSQRAAFEQPG